MPDGYRLLHATSSYPGAVATRLKLPFDPAGAFVPVAMIARAPFVLAVHPSVPAKTVKEFIAVARQRSLTYSSSGAGGSNHFAMELLGQMAGFKMIHVPYKGIAPAVVGLIGGDVDVDHRQFARRHDAGESGQGARHCREQRRAHAPRSRAAVDCGVGRARIRVRELVGPLRAREERRPRSSSTINATVNKVLTSAEMKQLLDREGAAATPMTVAQLADLLPKEIALYRKMAQAAGMKPE